MGRIGAVVFLVLLIMAFLAALATIPEHGIYGVGFAAIIGYAIYVLFIKPFAEVINESKSSEYEHPISNNATSTIDDDDDW